mgnify:CR=1 FL=1
MSKFRTHYENLQVIESASNEVIRGAYKHLSQKWHPDKHPDNRQRAERVTKIINAAYFVLSDPERKKEYDVGILERRKRASTKTDGKAKFTERPIVRKPNRNSSYTEDKFTNRQYHPWRRFLARNIDLLTSGILVYFLIISVITRFFPEMAVRLSQVVANELVAGFVLYILWIPIEAVFLCTLRTTPAKWIFGIFIQKIDGSNLSFSEAIYRVFYVYLKGEWFGIPFIKLIPNYFSYQRLKASGETSWDMEIGTRVTHRKWGVVRAGSAIGLTCLTIVIYSILIKGNNKNNIYNSQLKTNLSEQQVKPQYLTNRKVDNYQEINSKRIIQLNNECQESINMAITYWNGDDWESTGWWKVSSNSVVSTNLKTSVNKIYVYALSENYIWKGNAETGTMHPISNSSFISTLSDPVKFNDAKTVSFLLANVSSLNDKENYFVNLYCSSKVVNKPKKRFFGKKISMNLQGIDIRSVLQILADFSSLKIIASEQITGLVYATFKDTPWDEVMESIIHSKGYTYTNIKGTIYILTHHELENLRSHELTSQNNIFQTTVSNDVYAVEFSDGRVAEIKGDIKALRKEMRNGLLK